MPDTSLTKTAPSVEDAHPFSSEDAILQALNRIFPNTHPCVAIGRGDDCAVLRPSGPLCVSTDLFLEHVHFRQTYFSPEQIGRKALAVNLSDLAACGARPLGFSLGLTLPPHYSAQKVQALFQGMATLAAQHHIALTGGDLSRGQNLGLCITIWGEAAFPGAPFLHRGKAQPGHLLFLVKRAGTGPGLARVGFLSLEHAPESSAQIYPQAIRAHLEPEPLVTEGLALAAFAATHPEANMGLMDLSDGLARDVPRLLGPGLAAHLTIDPHTLPLDVIHYAQEHNQDPVACAWIGGEEYLLLGSCAPQAANALYREVPGVMFIGEAYSGSRILVNNAPAPESGFDHFAS